MDNSDRDHSEGPEVYGGR